MYVQTNANEIAKVMVMSASPNHLAPHDDDILMNTINTTQSCLCFDLEPVK